MNKRILATVTVGIALATFASADYSGTPNFTYTSGTAIDHDYSAVATPALTAHNQVTILPFLYVFGTLDGSWSVDGWGTANDSKMESVKFYHNEILKLVFTGFDDLAKTSGTAGGDQTLAMNAEVVCFKDSDNTSLADSTLDHASALNTFFSSGAAPTFDPANDGGTLRMEFTRKVFVVPTTGPGVYENTGTITVNRT